jgi:hypothetical protein
MNQRKEPAGGNLDQLAQSVATLALDQPHSALVADPAPPPFEMRADRRALPQHRSSADLWLAGVLFGLATIGVVVYLFAR